MREEITCTIRNEGEETQARVIIKGKDVHIEGWDKDGNWIVIKMPQDVARKVASFLEANGWGII